MKPPSENIFTSTMYSSQTAPLLGVVLVPTVHYLYTIHVKAIWWKTFVCFTAIFFFFFLFFSLNPHPQANHLSNLLCMAHMKQHRTRTTTTKQNYCLPCSFSTSIFASICQHWLQTEMLLLARRLKGTAFIEFIQLGLDCQNTNTPAKTPRLHQNIMHSIVMWGTSSAMTSSLHNSIHPPENGNKSSEDGMWLPMWWDNKKSHTRYLLSLCNALANAQLQTPNRPQCSAGQCYNNLKQSFLQKYTSKDSICHRN